jgi:hypothetical protein
MRLNSFFVIINTPCYLLINYDLIVIKIKAYRPLVYEALKTGSLEQLRLLTVLCFINKGFHTNRIYFMALQKNRPNAVYFSNTYVI